MTDALDLDALEAAERKASPAPWKSHYDGAIYRAATRGDRLVFADGDRCDAAFLVALRNAAPALIAIARRVQQDAAREGTHAPDCHLWGRRHYDCLLGKYEASRAEIGRLREALEAAEKVIVPIAKSYEPQYEGELEDAIPCGGEAIRDALAKARAALTSPAPVSPKGDAK